MTAPPCKQCEKHEAAIEKIAKAAGRCVRDWNADRDTGEAYSELRKAAERAGRMLARVRARQPK